MKNKGKILLLVSCLILFIFVFKKPASAASEWDKYSTKYYYNKMTDAQKNLYDQLDRSCSYYLNNAEDVKDFGTHTCYYNNLVNDEPYVVAAIFYFSNPQYYFLFTYNAKVEKTSATSGTVRLCIEDDFKKGGDRKAATAKFKEQIESYLAIINQKSTPFEKEQVAYNLVAGRTYPVGGKYNQSAYGALCEKRAVCMGYSFALSLLLNGAGIDSTVVTSKTHAWNYARINGCWYNLDCIADDGDLNDETYFFYNFFNRSTKEIQELDAIPGKHIPEKFWTEVNYLPQATHDAYENVKHPDPTFIEETYGDVYIPTQTVSQPDVVSTVRSGSNITYTLNCSTKNAVIYYTTDGTTPSCAATKSNRYSGPFTVSNQVVVKAIAVCDSYYDSPILITAAAAPVLTAKPASKTYTYGNRAVALKVSAYSKDNGKLSYQWYRSNSNRNSGGTAIKNATSNTYTPSVSSVGTAYYYCVVTNTNANALPNARTASSASAVAKITVNPINISKMSVKGIKTKTYSGKSQTQSFTVKLGSKVLTKNKDYTVSYKNNKAIGKASLTITGKGIYSGKRTYTFTIKPKRASLQSLSGQKKKFKVRWKKDNSITGYQIQYAKNKKFSKASSVKIKKNKTTSYTSKKLSAKKYYYVRIRSYKVVKGKTYYGDWSKVKCCRTRA